MLPFISEAQAAKYAARICPYLWIALEEGSEFNKKDAAARLESYKRDFGKLYVRTRLSLGVSRSEISMQRLVDILNAAGVQGVEVRDEREKGGRQIVFLVVDRRAALYLNAKRRVRSNPSEYARLRLDHQLSLSDEAGFFTPTALQVTWKTSKLTGKLLEIHFALYESHKSKESEALFRLCYNGETLQSETQGRLFPVLAVSSLVPAESGDGMPAPATATTATPPLSPDVPNVRLRSTATSARPEHGSDQRRDDQPGEAGQADEPSGVV